MGYETARVLALHGARVVVSTRSAASADAAVAKLKAAQPTADVTPLVLDLSSLKSVLTGAAAYLKAHDTLDVLINNAGVMASPFTLTADGLEEQIGVNHFAHALLSSLLLPGAASSCVIALIDCSPASSPLQGGDAVAPISSRQRFVRWPLAARPTRGH